MRRENNMKKSIMKLTCWILALTMLICNTKLSVNASEKIGDDDKVSLEYEEVILDNIESIITEMFSKEDTRESGNLNLDDLEMIEGIGNGETEITPQWGTKPHELSVDDDYGAELTAFLKTMCMIPDCPERSEGMPDEEYVKITYNINNTCDEAGDRNYLDLELSDTITLSDGSIFRADDITVDLKKHAILHGRGNYVASLRFLYTVAMNLVNETYSGTNVEVLQAAINDSLAVGDVENDTFYGESSTYANPTIQWFNDVGNPDGHEYIVNIYGGSDKKDESKDMFSSLEQRLTLEKCIYIVANMPISGTQAAYEELETGYSNVAAANVFEVKTALKIIGMATHLCGDIYAHKTVVPLDVTFVSTEAPSQASDRDNKTIYRGKNGSDFQGLGRWSATHGIKTLISAGTTITTQQIRQWQRQKTTQYPDSTKFYNERLNTGTKQLVANMYDNFFNGSSLGNMGFYVNWFLHTNYSLRLANLKLYTYSIGSQPTMQSRLTRLEQLDSAVAMSDVYPVGGYTTPRNNVNTWKKGYVSSLIISSY